MTTMIERVARALCVAAGADPDVTHDIGIIDDPDGIYGWAGYRKEARAAIEAMRETSAAVEKAGLEAIAKTGVGSPLHGWAAGDCYRAMIDAALKDAN